MIRCPNDSPKATYRVHLVVLHAKGEERVQIMGHSPVWGDTPHGRQVVEDCPSVSTVEDYVGELCEHELAWLNGEPGRDYKINYLFTVEPL